MMAGLSVSQQVVVLLDKGAPLSAFAMSEQIKALGGDTTTADINTRMHQMKTAGQARKEGDGWVLVDGQPLANLRAKWARDGQAMPVIATPPPVPPKAPTLRDRIVNALRAQPGMTQKELSTQLGDLSDNEPASTLNILTKQQRVRHEGEWPARRYFACDDSERLVLPRAGKRKKSGAESGLAKLAQARVDSAVAGVEIDQVEMLLQTWGTWWMPSALATAMQCDRDEMVKPLDQLVANGRAVSRYVSTLQRGKQYAHIDSAAARDMATPSTDSAEPAATPAGPTEAPQPVETGPLSDTHGPIASPAEGLRELAARDALLHAAQGASTALHEAAQVIEQLADEVDELDKAIGANPATLPGYARCIALDLEDAIGRACDQRADHAAIKALSVALGSTWRAITQLSPGA